ncbi:MAG: discoidin domain-containing protein [Kiritimatiellaeota bacterium]|nr:discoidin domain-containing protein [Kiritimatiellota bacterium]
MKNAYTVVKRGLAGLLAMGLCNAMAAGDDALVRDWLEQARLRFAPEPNAHGGAKGNYGGGGVKPSEDAAGAVDGKTDEPWGFHTGEDENPWWQVDLGGSVKLGKIVVHNRPGFEDRTKDIQVLLSQDGKEWSAFYAHDGKVFGINDKALSVPGKGASARFVRLQLPRKSYFHLNEVEVFAEGAAENVARGKAALQSSVSQWSQAHREKQEGVEWARIAAESLERGRKLAESLKQKGVDTGAFEKAAAALEKKIDGAGEDTYIAVRRAVRDLAMKNPLLNFDKLLVTKLLDPGWIYHMSDQWYGWWSRPGGGIYVLEDFKSGAPKETCLTAQFAEGCFQRPMLSWDAKKVVFAYCKFYPETNANRTKTDKATLPEDSFYHIYEMNIDGSGLRQLTSGKYNDFDARYLPDGRIVFLSTRRGWRTRYSNDDVLATIKNPALPESYVRCGGDDWRPVAVYTLHTMNTDGSDMRTISPFEMFEWTPTIANDGSIVYARWDYVDRHNMPYMGLWRVNPDGTQPSHFYGNYTRNPQSMFEPRPIPGSSKMVFTAGAHHANVGGSLVLVDVTRGEDGNAPIVRLTPEVPFAESETSGNGSVWLQHYYASPWPLSEDFYLTGWSWRGLRTHFAQNDDGARMGAYLYDAFGNLDLLCADPAFQVQHPIPVAAQKPPPVIASAVKEDAPLYGRFLLSNVYKSRQPFPEGKRVTALRIVAIPPKVQPHMNRPEIGVTADDPGKCVLGTVPVAEDGSANFLAPSNVTLFFQALDDDGVVVQTMRSGASLQPGQVWTCSGCHEPKDEASYTPTQQMAAAMKEEPAKITPEGEGSWPFRFDRLVAPVLKSACAACHTGAEKEPFAFKADPREAWKQLVNAGQPSVAALVKKGYNDATESVPGQGIAANAKLTKHIHRLWERGRIETADYRRLVLWMDVYGQYQGQFNDWQEQELADLRREWSATVLAGEQQQNAQVK